MKIFQLMLVMTLGHAVLCEDLEKLLGVSCGLDRCSVDGFNDWFKVGPYCAKYFDNEKLCFLDAERACREKHHHGHLISLHDSRTNNELITLTGNQNTESWIGGYQSRSVNNWAWTDGSKWGYQNWVPGQPSSSRVDFCVQINWDTPGKFDDDECKNKKTFVCAFPFAQ